MTWVVLGGGAFRDYFQHVMPHLSGCRSNLTNASLLGLWSKLFDPGNLHDAEQFELIAHSPLTARVGSCLSCLVVAALSGWVICRANSHSERDQAFGLAVTTMLLVSPVTWDHYFVLLALPLGLIWVALPPAPGVRICFAMILVALWTNPVNVWDAVFPQRTVATPLHTLSVLSFHLYAILGLFVLGMALAVPRRTSDCSSSQPQSPPCAV